MNISRPVRFNKVCVMHCHLNKLPAFTYMEQGDGEWQEDQTSFIYVIILSANTYQKTSVN
jgi:hypothetical protein